MEEPLEVSDWDSTLRDISAKLTAMITLCVENQLFTAREFESYHAQCLRMMDEQQTRLKEEQQREASRQANEPYKLRKLSRRIPAEVGALIVAAPFGNYLGGSEVTRTFGTFTAYARRTDQIHQGVYQPRDERFWWFGMLCRYLMTVRRQRASGGWVNRMGLRNPGVRRVSHLVRSGRIRHSNTVLSLYALEPDEWTTVFHRLGVFWPYPAAVELNFSCPNVRKDADLSEFITKGIKACNDWRQLLAERFGSPAPHPIAKFGPKAQLGHVDQAVRCNYALHLCNTLPVTKGGLSGTPLKTYALQMVQLAAHNWPHIPIIGGGGIKTVEDVQDYYNAGATHVSIASALFDRKYRKALSGLATYAKEHQPS